MILFAISGFWVWRKYFPPRRPSDTGPDAWNAFGQEQRDRMKFAEERIVMLEDQLKNAGIDFTPDYYKRIKISYKIAEDRVQYRNKKHAANV